MENDIKEALAKTAALARLSIHESDFDKLRTKAENVIKYVEQLAELDTKGIEPTSHTSLISTPLRNDIPVVSGLADVIMHEAPEREGPFLIVPKVIDEE
jgi:aspartyl-tRNA(Asn)/glutamyl-tRNA(Gln) amidotransferase subunit C